MAQESSEDIIEIIKILSSEKTHNEKKKQILTSLRRENLESLDQCRDEVLNSLSSLFLNLCTEDIKEDIKNQIIRTLDIIVPKVNRFDLFNSTSTLNDRKKRLKMFEILGILKTRTVIEIANKQSIVNLLDAALKSVNTTEMPCLATENAENRMILMKMKEEKENGEESISTERFQCISLIKKILDSEKNDYAKLDSLLMDKIILLAYMGTGELQKLSIQILYTAHYQNLGKRVRLRMPEVWNAYKNKLSTIYCKRMCLLVTSSEEKCLQWAHLWKLSIQFLGSDLHSNSTQLVNSILKVEELAFKSADPNRSEAFKLWELLIDNFSSNSRDLATPRRLKLLMIPLKAKNTKIASLIHTKLDVWWYLIYKIYSELSKFSDLVLVEFLNFCFGPFTNKPLKSIKVETAAKNYIDTQILAIDAFTQLLVDQNESSEYVLKKLKSRIPHPVEMNIFERHYKEFMYSFAEVISEISNIPEKDIKYRLELTQILWDNLLKKVAKCNENIKKSLYQELICIIIALFNQERVLLNSFLLNVVLNNICTIISHTSFSDKILEDLMFCYFKKDIFELLSKEHMNQIEEFLNRAFSSNSVSSVNYNPNTLEFIQLFLNNLNYVSQHKLYRERVMDIWIILGKILIKYIENGQRIDESEDLGKYDFSTIKQFLMFPLQRFTLSDQEEIKNIYNYWETLYKQFNFQASFNIKVKSHEILGTISDAIMNSLKLNDNFEFAAFCSAVLLNTINYTDLTDMKGVLSYAQLLDYLCIMCLKNQSFNSDIPIKSLSKLLSKMYSHDNQKTMLLLRSVVNSVEFMLKFSEFKKIETIALKSLERDVKELWENIVNIMKNLHNHNLLDSEFFKTYGRIIYAATNHQDTDIYKLATSINGFANHESYDGLIKDLINKGFNDFGSKQKKVLFHEKQKSSENSKNGQVLNSTPKASIKSRLSIPTTNFLDADSQDYPMFQSNVKLDVDLLTEHQKDNLKKRNESIPALLNDCSGSSQDTQDLHQTFCAAQKILNKSLNKSIDVQKIDPKTMDDVTSIESSQKENTEIYRENIVERLSTNQIERQLSPSIIENTKRKKITSDSKDDVKIKQSQKHFPNNVSSDAKIPKRGTKRRVSELNPAGVLDIKREKRSRHSADILPSTEIAQDEAVDNIENFKKFNKATKNELMRLKIDMIGTKQPEIDLLEDDSRKRNNKRKSSGRNDKSNISNNDCDNLKRNRRFTKNGIKKEEELVEQIKGGVTNLEDNDTSNSNTPSVLDKRKNEVTVESQTIEKDKESIDEEISSQDSDIIESSQEPMTSKLTQPFCDRDMSQLKNPDLLLTKVGKNSDDPENNLNEDKSVQIIEIETPLTTNSQTEVKLTDNRLSGAGVTSNTSPKSMRLNKSKTFPLQGRGAQIIGLVTNQHSSEKTEINHSEELLLTTNNKKDKNPSKDSKEAIPCSGSRQEKIFSYMNNKNGRDCVSSPSIKMFNQLRNDGESISPKEKNAKDMFTVNNNDINEEEIDEVNNKNKHLPIFEWSNNNPSLSASPSASILKRHVFNIDSEIDTPSQKKRVSFRDPPVSKAMGYEVDYDENQSSPHRFNKIPTNRSPVSRAKQSRIKQTLMSFITENTRANSNDVNDSVLCESLIEGDILTRSVDVEILAPSIQSPRVNLSKVISGMEEFKKEDSKVLPGTQEDLFENICNGDDKSEALDDYELCKKNHKDTKIKSSYGSYLKYESLGISNVPKVEISLEDTVDINNVTSLNSTSNSDELYCRPIISSSQHQNAEQDTLPVTDSMFSSGPISQETQNCSLDNIQLPQPETLDSTLPIYPSLIPCTDSIEFIQKDLVNPLWELNFASILSERGLKTIGQLAQLSEREINRMPIKGNTKVIHVKNILSDYENREQRNKSLQKITTVSSSTPLKSGTQRDSDASKPLIKDDQIVNYPLLESMRQNISNIISPRNVANTLAEQMEFAGNNQLSFTTRDKFRNCDNSFEILIKSLEEVDANKFASAQLKEIFKNKNCKNAMKRLLEECEDEAEIDEISKLIEQKRGGPSNSQSSVSSINSGRKDRTTDDLAEKLKSMSQEEILSLIKMINNDKLCASEELLNLLLTNVTKETICGLRKPILKKLNTKEVFQFLSDEMNERI